MPLFNSYVSWVHEWNLHRYTWKSLCFDGCNLHLDGWAPYLGPLNVKPTQSLEIPNFAVDLNFPVPLQSLGLGKGWARTAGLSRPGNLRAKAHAQEAAPAQGQTSLGGPASALLPQVWSYILYLWVEWKPYSIWGLLSFNTHILYYVDIHIVIYCVHIVYVQKNIIRINIW